MPKPQHTCMFAIFSQLLFHINFLFTKWRVVVYSVPIGIWHHQLYFTHWRIDEWPKEGLINKMMQLLWKNNKDVSLWLSWVWNNQNSLLWKWIWEGTGKGANITQNKLTSVISTFNITWSLYRTGSYFLISLLRRVSFLDQSMHQKLWIMQQKANLRFLLVYWRTDAALSH